MLQIFVGQYVVILPLIEKIFWSAGIHPTLWMRPLLKLFNVIVRMG